MGPARMTLYQHQLDGAEWLAGRAHAYLGDKPGMGKTRTILHALKLAGAKHPLVFCPAIVKTHWKKESNDTVRVHSYDAATAGEFGMMRKEIQDQPCDALILDEAHYLKHSVAQRTRILLGPNGYARRIPRVWCASGTPVPRHPGELWTVLSSLFPAVALAHGLRTRADFESRFCVTKGRLVQNVWREKVVGMKEDAEFQEILDAIMLRRDAGADVPPIWWQSLVLDGDEVFGPGFVPADLVHLGDTPHVATYRRRVGEAKAKAVIEMLSRELQCSDEKVVIFAHHRSVLDALFNGLKTFGAAKIDGSTPGINRTAGLSRFVYEPECRVFIGQNQACGTGFDGLQQACSRMVIVEPSWVAEENAQLGARLARMGQLAPTVRAQMVSLAGTIDEWIVAQNVREMQMHDRMFPEEKVA